MGTLSVSKGDCCGCTTGARNCGHEQPIRGAIFQQGWFLCVAPGACDSGHVEAIVGVPSVSKGGCVRLQGRATVDMKRTIMGALCVSKGGCCVRLQGRATVDMKIKLKEVRQDGVEGGNLKIVVDGFNAPVTGGNFIDLVHRGFYSNMEIQRADGFIVQTGDPGPPVSVEDSCLLC